MHSLSLMDFSSLTPFKLRQTFYICLYITPTSSKRTLPRSHAVVSSSVFRVLLTIAGVERVGEELFHTDVDMCVNLSLLTLFHESFYRLWEESSSQNIHYAGLQYRWNLQNMNVCVLALRGHKKNVINPELKYPHHSTPPGVIIAESSSTCFTATRETTEMHARNKQYCFCHCCSCKLTLLKR